MKIITREIIKKIFKKVKHLRLDPEFDRIDFAGLNYYSWWDKTDNVLFILSEYQGELVGIKWKITKSKSANRLELCEICRKHRQSNEISLVTAKTKHLPKGIDFRTRGNYVCLDCKSCNQEMKDNEGINRLFGMILENEK